MKKTGVYVEMIKGVAGSVVDLATGVLSCGASWFVRLKVGAGAKFIKCGINAVNLT